MEMTNSRLRKTIAAMAKTPEEWLQEVSPQKERGIFKLFLGYAPGVGKTYSMLSEAIRRASRGEDIVVGVVESHGRKATAELAAKLDRVPPRKLEYKGTVFDEMDVDAILARKPAVVLIDELGQLGFLLRSQDLEQFGLDSRPLHEQFDCCPRLLRSQSANFGFIEATARHHFT